MVGQKGMSEYERKFESAMAELRATGIWKMNYDMPYVRFLRALKLRPRPPYYAKFWKNFLGFGGYFAVGWGILMSLSSWNDMPAPLWVDVLSSLIAGVMFGVLMAYYYDHGHLKYKLTNWEDL